MTDQHDQEPQAKRWGRVAWVLGGLLVVGVGVAAIVQSRSADDGGEPNSASARDVTGMRNGLWVVPEDVPTGFELRGASVQGLGNEQWLEYGDAADESFYVVSMSPIDVPRRAEALEIAGATWYVEPLSSDGGWSFTRHLPEITIALVGRGERNVLEAVAGSLVTIDEPDLGIEVTGTENRRFFYLPATTAEADGGTLELGVIESEGRYCFSVRHAQSSDASCDDPPEPDAPIVVTDYWNSGAAYFLFGIADADVANIRIGWADGSTYAVDPEDESGRFPHRFWAVQVGPPVDGEFTSAVDVEYVDGSSASLVVDAAFTWRLDEPAG